jgi:hypothetical protein
MAWDEVRAQLAAARTPREKQDAAVTLMRHIDQRFMTKRFVHMHTGVAHSIRLSDLHRAMSDDETYDLVNRMISGGR